MNACNVDFDSKSSGLHTVARFMKDATVNGNKVDVTIKATKDGSIDMSYTLNGQSVAISDKDQLQFKGKNVTLEDIRTLYTAADFIDSTKYGFEVMALQLSRDAEGMLELGRELAERDDIDSGHKEHLLNLLSSMGAVLEEAVPKINVMLTEGLDANEGFIEFNDKSEIANIYLQTGVTASNRSQLETYVHELWHAAVRYALMGRKAVTGPLLLEAEKTRTKFMERYTAEELAKFVDGPDRLKEAQRLINYMSSSMDEFIVHAGTHKAVIKALKAIPVSRTKIGDATSLFGKVVNMIKKVLEILGEKFTKVPTTNDYAKMVWLTERLMKVNSNALVKKKANALSTIGNMIRRGDEYLSQKISKVEKQLANVQIKPAKTRLGRVMNAVKLITASTVDANIKAAMEQAMYNYGVKPEGFVGNLVNALVKADDWTYIVQRAGLLAVNIDNDKMSAETEVKKELMEAAGGKLTNEMNSAIKTVMESDLQGLAKYYDGDDLIRLVSDEAALDAEIAALENDPMFDQGSVRKNYFKGQVRGLARQMTTGKASSLQLENAYAIAHRLNDVDPEVLGSVSEGFIELIDKMVNLHAIKLQSKEAKENLSMVMNDHPMVVTVAVRYATLLAKEYEELQTTLGHHRVTRIKGDYKVPYDKNVDVKHAPVEDEKELAKFGYKLVKTFEVPSGVGGPKVMGVFRSTMPMSTGLVKVGMRYTNPNRKITTLESSYSDIDPVIISSRRMTDVARVGHVNLDKLDRLRKGDMSVMEEDSGIAPVLDSSGKVFTYRYVEDRDFIEEELGGVQNGAELLSYNVALAVDKRYSILHNLEVMVPLIKKDMQDNFVKNGINKNNKLYAWIGPDSTDPKMKAMWDIIPPYVKKQFSEPVLNEDGDVIGEKPTGFAIRRDLLLDYLGAREMSTTNGKWITKLPDRWQYAYRFASMVWKDIIKMEKVAIVIKMPEVIVDNVISNWNLIVMSGFNPIKAMKLQVEGWKALSAYVEDRKVIHKLEVKAKIGKLTQAETNLLKQKKDFIARSPIAPLIDEGLYTQILEELTIGDERTQDSVIGGYFDKKLEKAPKLIRNGVDWLLLSPNTPVTKFISQATQFSDFAARYAKYHLLIEKGTSKEDAIRTVKDDFVNYNAADSRLMQWANNNGLVMFSKYYTRIQRAITHTAKTNPLSFVLTLGLISVFAEDTANVTDSSFLVKSPFNMVHLNPLEHLGTALTPGAIHFTSGL